MFANPDVRTINHDTDKLKKEKVTSMIKNSNKGESNNKTAIQPSAQNKSTLILLRHGKSIWNGGTAGQEPRFTGWADVPLTVEGRVEAVATGLLLRHRGLKAKNVCVAFASELERSHETCELVLASMAGHQQDSWSSKRIRREWRLNERHWGCIQGKYKNDPELVKQYGKDTLIHWRRSLKGKPPPLENQACLVRQRPNGETVRIRTPLTESLWDCQRRAVDCWYRTISKALFDEQNLPNPPEKRTVLVVAHANTIRALMAHFDDVEECQVPKLYVPNSVPIVYTFDTETRMPIEDKLYKQGGLIGSHARWMLSKENHRHIKNAIGHGGILTRALFDFLDIKKEGKVCRSDLENGIRELQNPNNDEDGGIPPYVRDCVVVDVAKKCAFEMKVDEYVTFEEFERRTEFAYREIQYYSDYKVDNKTNNEKLTEIIEEEKRQIEWL